MDAPEIRYAMSGDVHIAYQAFGDGPLTLVVNPGSYSHLQLDWENPPRVAFYEGLAAFARVVIYDKRGTGLSDRGVGVPPLEVRIDDARAVMDAEGIDEAALMGYSEGGAMALLFAATHPQRVRSLVLHGVNPTGQSHPDVPGSDRARARYDRELESVRTRWGSGEHVADYMGDELGTPEMAESMGRYQRMAQSPSDAIHLVEMAIATDVRALLPTIAVPTLVMARTRDRVAPRESVRYIADHIPGATFWEQDGPHVPWLPPNTELVDRIEEFLSDSSFDTRSTRVLSTVLFSDIVSSTDRAASLGDRRWAALLDQHDGLVEAQVRRFRGQVIKTTGDGVLATFDAPGRAVSCAQAMLDGAHAIDLELRIGVHTGEIELRGADIGGLAVNIAARVEAAAGDGEIFVTRTLTDLVAGSDLRFTDRGEHNLKGVPSSWQLFAVADTG